MWWCVKPGTVSVKNAPQQHRQVIGSRLCRDPLAADATRASDGIAGDSHITRMTGGSNIGVTMNPNDEDISDELLTALRAGSLHLWNAAAIFLSLFYLTGAVLKSLVIAGVVLISSFLGFGSRRLIQAGFALAVVAVLVS